MYKILHTTQHITSAILDLFTWFNSYYIISSIDVTFQKNLNYHRGKLKKN